MINPAQIIATAAALYGVTPELLVSNNRTARVSAARNMAVTAIQDCHPELTLKELGAHVGGRDHSTISYALHNVRESLKYDPAAVTRWKELHSRLGIELNPDSLRAEPGQTLPAVLGSIIRAHPQSVRIIIDVRVETVEEQTYD